MVLKHVVRRIVVSYSTLSSYWALALVPALLLQGEAVGAPASASIELNVVPSSRAPVTAAQDWVRALASLESVRVRSGGGGRSARPAVKRTGTTVHITAVIDGSNQLVVPGRRFSIREKSALQKWLDQQRTGDTVDVQKDRFGLTRSQLEQVHDALKRTVLNSTKGSDVRELVTSLTRQTGFVLNVALPARRAWNGGVVTDEWKGFSSGTVIAAVLRPLELVMIPQVGKAGRLELLVTSDASAREVWPVGWKSKLNNRELIPRIYDPLPVQIHDTPIADVMAALGARLEVAMFYDIGLLSAMQIDPKTERVTLNSDRMIYVKAIRSSLFKAKMKSEIRVDERGKPFIWIIPRRTPGPALPLQN